MTKDEISNSELIKKAETRLFKEAQKTITQEEIKRWKLSKDQEELWRVSGRLALQLHNEKPIYIPREHPIVTQLILEAHENCGHFGTAYTLTAFRERFSIDKSRSHVKRILKEQCYKCRRYRTNKFALPAMDPLSEERKR
uniref:Integrase_H2C2 domain-containing protein n=1 Tax=Syphacia muris TaxID=451379 RepID=A0A0N5B1J3_9BILA